MLTATTYLLRHLKKYPQPQVATTDAPDPSGMLSSTSLHSIIDLVINCAKYQLHHSNHE